MNRVVLIGLAYILITACGCSDSRSPNKISTEEFMKSLKDEKLLNSLVDRYLSRLNTEAKKDFDSTARIVDVGLDSSSTLAAFRPFWLKEISHLKTSDSLDYVFYDSSFRKSLTEQLKHRRFPDSIRYFKAQIKILEGKIDSTKRGLFANPVLEQLSRLSKENGMIYFLSTEIAYEEDKSFKMYFGIEELETDTVVSWTTDKSLSKYMRKAIFRRNSSYWTKGLKKLEEEKKKEGEKGSKAQAV